MPEVVDKTANPPIVAWGTAPFDAHDFIDWEWVGKQIAPPPAVRELETVQWYQSAARWCQSVALEQKLVTITWRERTDVAGLWHAKTGYALRDGVTLEQLLGALMLATQGAHINVQPP